ncbi:hypothetical protein BDR04DRAFT_1107742 [Suillus decipiens]|nr:hypothetical protein BDR04DRAFT_1107742 [Suillus decipiens]
MNIMPHVSRKCLPRARFNQTRRSHGSSTLFLRLHEPQDAVIIFVPFVTSIDNLRSQICDRLL